MKQLRPIKDPEEEKKVAAILPQQNDISTLKEEQKSQPKPFLGEKDDFTLLQIGFG